MPTELRALLVPHLLYASTGSTDTDPGPLLYFGNLETAGRPTRKKAQAFPPGFLVAKLKI
jgi:hypothetical protein